MVENSPSPLTVMNCKIMACLLLAYYLFASRNLYYATPAEELKMEIFKYRQCIFAIALTVEKGVDLNLKNKTEYPSTKDSW